jgi:hypothetical protein
MLLHGEERQVCLQMDEQIAREVLLRTAVKMLPRIATRVKYWEIIADNLSKAGWSLGWVFCGGSRRANNLDC